mmetsp:Transcript_41331/g.88090  ORF Transcript_41331/g.88090 Transcript_41331/m.88090 type:complete len:81 (+) Transcript_41331:119-361(+)
MSCRPGRYPRRGCALAIIPWGGRIERREVFFESEKNFEAPNIWFRFRYDIPFQEPSPSRLDIESIFADAGFWQGGTGGKS